ncbi:thiamine pyrophosphate-binding protein [Ramlibacter sp. G-1-2-2]|uniref:Thiamine pyrophosphate-binding protein n=1 Tax=Ramlibacter agri TaxID=2728837 RepID=A0A848H9A0_9BURK|nr:thiamine pyrophosphate-binding protein [Ramlibacter agri]NML47566.1 thiamine pyrophosphate-binding protein [Ramlibacter agri]
MKVYEAVAAGLIAEGVDQMFGLMGDGNMSLWATLVKDGQVDIVSSGHEQAALAMADGYHRATGRVGVATVTHGPGLTQVATSLTIAVRNRSALVLFIGQTRRGARYATQRLDPRPFVEACGARLVDVTTPENLAAEMAEAFYIARVQRTPVVLNIDVALQERAFDWDFNYRPSTEYLPLPAGVPSDDVMNTLIEKLEAAEWPVIVAGIGAMKAQAKPEILALGEQLGALLATSLQAKGFFSGEEYDVGISGAFSSEPTERLLGDADFVLGVGAELGYYTSEGGMLFPIAEVARIDSHPLQAEIGPFPGLYVHGDAKKTVALLVQRLRERKVARTGFRDKDTRAILAAPPHEFARASDGIDPRQLAHAIGAALPRNSLVTCGNCHFWAFPAMYMPLPEGAELRFSYQFGAIGQTIPLAIGIAKANPGRPQVVIEGDGAMLMNLQELFTIQRFKLSMVVVVWNDNGFGAEVHKLKAKGFDPSHAQWEQADFVALARAFGGDGARATSVGEVGTAIQQGLKKGGLFIVDAQVSPTTVSDPYSKLHFGVPNQAPLLRPLAAER